MKHWHILFIILLLAFIIPVKSVFANEDGMVLIAKGDTQVKLTGTAEWQPLKSRDKVIPGSEIRSGSDGSIKIMNANGSLLKIGSNKSLTYQPDSAGKPQNMKVFLNELSGSKNLKQIAATRGNSPEQALWIKFMTSESIVDDEVESLFQLTEHFQKDQPGKSAALLWKFQQNVPDHPGMLQMIQASLASWSAKPDWYVVKKTDNQKAKISEGSQVRLNDGLQVYYTASQDTYYYMFYTTRPANGVSETYNLFPESVTEVEKNVLSTEFISRIKADKQQILPSEREFYELDATLGTEHLWGWSCAGPVTSAETIQQAINQVEAMISSQGTVSTDDIQKIAPPICPSVLALNLKHL
ncbi:MAG: hypothetical protein HQM11_08105 [SAR324 cluster bacterium]|nr:hypothetical protein [SAR324 cluster bacterium]